MVLRLLHLSDIHFQDGSRGWDDNRDQRKEIVTEVRGYAESEGPFDAILIGGDIAYSGHPDEYARAADWINSLVLASGAPGPESVFTVPGNHDIDRSVISKSQLLMDFRSVFDNAPTSAIEYELHRRLSEDPGAPALFSHLDAYNAFASRYICTVSPVSPSWVNEDLRLAGRKVRIAGLTSVLNSGPKDDGKPPSPTLVLGTHQCQMDREDQTVNLVLVHHPPSWIKDWSIVEPSLRRAHLWLFGHEHSFSSMQPWTGATVEVHAGAVGPEQDREGERDPYLSSFNVIEIDADDAYGVEISIHALVWDRGATRYARASSTVYSVPQHPAVTDGDTSREEAESLPSESFQPASTSPLSPEPGSRETSDEPLDLRRLAVKFMSQSVSTRLDIGRALQVLDDEDLATPPTALYPELLRRIRDRGLIDRLREELGE